MKAWVGYMQAKAQMIYGTLAFILVTGFLSSLMIMMAGLRTDKYLIAQCFYAHSIHLVINAAKVLGNGSDVKIYTDLLQKIKDAFVKEYMTANGRLVSSTQTAYVLALSFDMLPENLREQAAERLVENIKQFDNHLTTGFLGTPYLCDVLTRFGYTILPINY